MLFLNNIQKKSCTQNLAENESYNRQILWNISRGIISNSHHVSGQRGIIWPPQVMWEVLYMKIWTFNFFHKKMFSLPLKLTFLDLRVFRFKNKILMTRLYKCKTFCSVLKPFKALFCSKLNHKIYSKLKNWKNLQP